MSKYTVKSYQEGFAEDQARLDIEVSMTWIMPDHTPFDQLTQFYSDLDIDPELRLYCFLKDTMIGFVSGQNNTEGSYNTFLGTYSGKNNTTGESNVFIGDGAAHSNQTGSGNVYMGRNAGNSDTN